VSLLVVLVIAFTMHFEYTLPCKITKEDDRILYRKRYGCIFFVNETQNPV